jgi:hypothetical protein
MAFFFAHSMPCRTPDDTKGRKWGRVEGNRDTVCRKARGQFPNNPCGWSNHQAEGHPVKVWSMMILHGRGGTFPLYSLG